MTLAATALQMLRARGPGAAGRRRALPEQQREDRRKSLEHVACKLDDKGREEDGCGPSLFRLKAATRSFTSAAMLLHP